MGGFFKIRNQQSAHTLLKPCPGDPYLSSTLGIPYNWRNDAIDELLYFIDSPTEGSPGGNDQTSSADILADNSIDNDFPEGLGYGTTKVDEEPS